MAAFGSYVVIAAAGYFQPRLEMYADVVWRGPSRVAQVALTFEGGPHPRHTREVLKLLESFEAKATFFVYGHKVEAHPEVANEIVARGYGLSIRGYAPDRWLNFRSPNQIMQDLDKALTAIDNATATRPILFRPPHGHIGPRLDTAATRLGLTLVLGSVRASDAFSKVSSKNIIARVQRGLRPGSIIVLHDAVEGDDCRPASLDALAGVLGAIHAQGLRCVDIVQLLEVDEEPSHRR